MTPRAGWVYAVRGGDDVKVGLTTETCVYSYLHKNYSRTYTSWTAVQLLQVDDVHHAERCLLYVLRPHLQNEKHELVRCSDGNLEDAFNKVSVFFHDRNQTVTDMKKAASVWESAQTDRKKKKQQSEETKQKQQNLEDKVKKAI